MHEIGHIVLGHTEDSELAEAEVKFFAKYALAPPVLMEKYNVTNIVDVLSHFDISMEAAYRKRKNDICRHSRLHQDHRGQKDVH